MTVAFSTLEEHLYRFDEFQVDPVRRLLLRDGEPVAITPKALAILVVLLENQGKVVPKEELIRQVWGAGYVSDANLTQNISFARKALGERAGDRRYIVTVPGRGYCFAAPITAPGVPEADTAAPAEAAADPPPEAPAGTAVLARPVTPVPPGSLSPASPPEAVAGPAAAPPAPAAPPGRPWLRIAIGAALLILVIGLSSTLSRLGRGSLAPAADLEVPTVPQRTSIAVLAFKNLSGETRNDWLGSALAEMLTTELAAGSRVRVISRENVARARGLESPGSGVPDGATLDRIRDMLGADLLVSGSYLALGEESNSRIRLDLRVSGEKRELVASLAEVGSEPELFEMVSRTGAKLRQALGFAEPSPEQAQAVRALQPAGSEALRLYAEGLERMRSFDAPRAVELLRQAAEADPGSAVIRADLAKALGELGYDAQAVAEAKKAVELSGALPREARLGIEARFYELSREWGEATEIYASLRTFFPDDLEYGLQLGTSLMMSGRGREARETAASLRRLPGSQGQDARIDILECRIARRLSDLAGQMRAAEVAVAKGWHSGERLVVAQGLIYQGEVLLHRGEPGKAIGHLRKAEELARAEGHLFLTGMALSTLGKSQLALGDLDGAERSQRESLRIAERIGSAAGIAAQYAMLGQLYEERGELAKALEHLEASRSRYVQLQDRMMEARSLSAISRVKWLLGDFPAAREVSEAALRISRDIGSRREEAVALNQLGRTFTWLGEPAEGLRRHEEAFVLFRQIGDANLAASALADSAGLMAWMNDLPGARRRYRRALLTKRRMGDRLGMAEILDRLAGLAYREGDIPRSRRLAEWELRIVEETGARNLLAKALTRLGRVQWAAAEPGAARRTLERSLALSTARGEEMERLVIHLYLANLALSEGRYGEAARLAGHATAGYRARGVDVSELQAVSLHAQALLFEGKLAEARQAADRARALFASTDAVEIQALVAARIAYIDAAGGHAERAARDLHPYVERAKAGGFGGVYLQARLALGEILLATNAKAGRATLLELRNEAAERGFVDLSRRAGRILETGGVLAGWTAPRS